MSIGPERVQTTDTFEFKNGGPFFKDPSPPTTSTPQSEENKTKGTKRKRKSQEAQNNEAKGEKKEGKKTNLSRTKPTETALPARNVQNETEEIKNFPETCQKYEMLREKYMALLHDHSHLHYRYHEEVLKNKTTRTNLVQTRKRNDSPRQRKKRVTCPTCGKSGQVQLEAIMEKPSEEEGEEEEGEEEEEEEEEEKTVKDEVVEY